MIGLLSMHFSIPECRSLKQKRGKIKPILSRIHREFNVAAAETNLQDLHREAGVQCAALSTSCGEVQGFLQHIVDYTKANWPDIEILEYHIECI